MKKENNKDKKISLKEKLKDRRERAKFELILYGIFFLGVIIFTRILSYSSSQIEKDNTIETTFITAINDNYEYDIQLAIGDKIYEYYGKVLGNNRTIDFKEEDKITSYYYMNKKYYIKENDNYIMVDDEEVFPYINYRYLNIKNIKEYIKISTKTDNVYKIKLSDIVLNIDNDNYITITTDEGDKSITIDYTYLFKLQDEAVDKVVVNITYTNIDKIVSLEE